MNAGIGTAATNAFYRLAQNNGECIIQNLLYRNGIWLSLPSVIVGTIIRKLDEIALCAHAAKVVNNNNRLSC